MPKKTPSVLDDSLVVRVESKSLDRFKKNCLKQTGKPYQLFVREMVDAFNDGRLRIKPTPEQATYVTGELYNVN